MNRPAHPVMVRAVVGQSLGVNGGHGSVLIEAPGHPAKAVHPDSHRQQCSQQRQQPVPARVPIRLPLHLGPEQKPVYGQSAEYRGGEKENKIHTFRYVNYFTIM